MRNPNPDNVLPASRAAAATDSPKVLEKALRVLGLFTERRPAWTTTEVARELDLPLTTTHRIVRGLEGNQFLRRTTGGHYRLGLEAISLGRRAASSFDLRTVLRPSLEWLSLETNETTCIAIFDEGRLAALYMDKIERTHAVRVSIEIGSVTPLHASAHGLALLAFLGDDVLQRVLERARKQTDGGSIEDPELLQNSIALVREKGFAFARNEATEGVWEMAAPVLDAHGTPLASIGFLSPSFRLAPDLQLRGGEYVVRAARQAEAHLGSE